MIGSIQNWEVIPNEIIIVDSSEVKPLIPEEFKQFVKKFDIRLLTIFEKNLYPGHARNIGISNSTNNLLAFLDTSTMPCHKWLSSGLNLIKKQNTDGVWGHTHYLADKFFRKFLGHVLMEQNQLKLFQEVYCKKIFLTDVDYLLKTLEQERMVIG